MSKNCRHIGPDLRRTTQKFRHGMNTSEISIQSKNLVSRQASTHFVAQPTHAVNGRTPDTPAGLSRLCHRRLLRPTILVPVKCEQFAGRVPRTVGATRPEGSEPFVSRERFKHEASSTGKRGRTTSYLLSPAIIDLRTINRLAREASSQSQLTR
ncbi:hypothetical protein PAXINDRAFT_97176 [Paxillus involutus ATCC 200175]|nr:hypothetical protein PAXINDRAFT_97176 [Paxillus involutus ATCC 200175]